MPMLGVTLWKTVKPLLDGSTAAKVSIILDQIYYKNALLVLS